MRVKQRDWSVELMRIIGCLIVIGCHTIPWPISVGGVYLNSKVLLQCFYGDGVLLFTAVLCNGFGRQFLRGTSEQQIHG